MLHPRIYTTATGAPVILPEGTKTRQRAHTGKTRNAAQTRGAAQTYNSGEIEALLARVLSAVSPQNKKSDPALPAAFSHCTTTTHAGTKRVAARNLFSGKPKSKPAVKSRNSDGRIGAATVQLTYKKNAETIRTAAKARPGEKHTASVVGGSGASTCRLPKAHLFSVLVPYQSSKKNKR